MQRVPVLLALALSSAALAPSAAAQARKLSGELARGKLLLDVKANVVGNKIDATNVITLNQFTFGTPVKSPDATSLPVRLGVALLKDMDGKIVIDVPVQGSTDDPSFRVGRVVLRVIVNLLTKAAVSPFSLLGAAFGGGGDELAFQDFDPGSTEIRPMSSPFAGSPRTNPCRIKASREYASSSRVICSFRCRISAFAGVGSPSR